MPGLISLDELGAAETMTLADRAVALYRDRTDHCRPLAGMVAGLLFLQTSTRTRTAFSVGAARLGAGTLSFGPADLQLNTGESIQDTGRILASMLDCLIVRTSGPSSLLISLSCGDTLPTINAMSAQEHPTQGLNDLAALRLYVGDLSGLRFLYVGEGNNTAVALAKALCHIPSCELTFCTPPGYGLDAKLIFASDKTAGLYGGSVRQISDMALVPDTVDVAYTTRWHTTGTSKSDPSWRETFRPFYLDDNLLRRWPDAIVMHDLPAHRGEEISGKLLDGPRSIAWKQGAMKLASAMAVLERVTHPSLASKAGQPAPGREGL